LKQADPLRSARAGDPEAGTVTVYVLSGSTYAAHAAGGSGDSVTSPTLPGFEVAVSDALGAR